VATIRGKPKKQIGYKIPTDLQKKIDAAIAQGEFSSQADIITASLRSFFDKREFETLVENKVIEFLKSETGMQVKRELAKR
jgi:Arc/MetJ-type ribon-helix-helix transcriptional regulator